MKFQKLPVWLASWPAMLERMSKLGSQQCILYFLGIFTFPHKIRAMTQPKYLHKILRVIFLWLFFGVFFCILPYDFFSIDIGLKTLQNPFPLFLIFTQSIIVVCWCKISQIKKCMNYFKLKLFLIKYSFFRDLPRVLIFTYEKFLQEYNNSYHAFKRHI